MSRPLLLQSSICVSVLLGLAAGCDPSVEERAGMGLLKQFSNSCITHGHWTELAVSQNQALKAALEDLKGQDQCKPFAAQLATIQGLSDSISKAIDDSQYKKYLKNRSALSDLVPVTHQLLPAGGLSADAQTLLLQSGFDKQLALKKLNADYDVSRADLQGNVFRKSSEDLIRNLQGMMGNIDGIQNCLMQSPLAAGQLAVQLLAVAGNSTDSSVMGASINTLGALINAALSFESPSARIERAKVQVDRATLAKGLVCAMESMTELYCKADDAQELLQFQARSLRSRTDRDKQMVEPIWQGMNLLSRRLPMIARQLLTVRSGNNPNDPFDSSRQSAIWESVYTLQKTYIEANGLIANSEGNYNSTVDADTREGFTIDCISKLAVMMDSSEPFSTNVSTDKMRLACMVTRDPAGKECPAIIPQETLDNYIRRNSLQSASFATIKSNFEVLYMRASRAVNIDLARKIVIDPQQSVVGLREPELGNVSFYEALVELDRFLDQFGKLRKSSPKLDWNPLLEGELKDTKKRVREVLDVLNPDSKTLADLTTRDKFNAMLGQVFTSFELRLNTQFLPQRIKKLVEWDLNTRIRNGELPGSATEILIQMAGELTDDMGADGRPLEPASMDVSSAKSLIQSDMRTFLGMFSQGGSLFSNAIEEAASFLLRQARDAGEPVTGAGRRDNRQLLAELCILAASIYPKANPMDMSSDMPLFSKGAPGQLIEACRGAVLQSVYADHSQVDGGAVAGLPLSLHYGELFSLFSGRTLALEKIDRVGKIRWVREALGLKPSGRMRDLWAADPYEEIFRQTLFSKSTEEEMAFPRKVCTFHRFLRASRIREALPALNPEFREALFK